MRTISLFFSLLLSLTAFGQPSPINRRAFALAGLANNGCSIAPNQIAGLAYWWVSADLPLDVKVTNWVDRIQGLVATNGSNALRPTNSSTGVGFDTTTYLTNIAVGGSAPISWFTIMSMNARDTIRGFSLNTSHGFFFDSGILGNATWEYIQGTTVLCSGANGRLKTNTFFTLAYSCSISASDHTMYTNGVKSASIASGSMEFPTFRAIGGNESVSPLNGKIREIAIFTNQLSSNDVYGLNCYATNTYGYTP